MATLQIIYPVITRHIIMIEVPDDQADDLFKRDVKDQAKFIYQLNEKAELPYITSQKMIEDGMYEGYTQINQIAV